MEDTPRLVHMLRCVLGLEKVEQPPKELLQRESSLSSSSSSLLASRGGGGGGGGGGAGANGAASDLVAAAGNGGLEGAQLRQKIEELNQIDLELYAFAVELFDLRWSGLGIMHKSGFAQC